MDLFSSDACEIPFDFVFLCFFCHFLKQLSEICSTHITIHWVKSISIGDWIAVFLPNSDTDPIKFWFLINQSVIKDFGLICNWTSLVNYTALPRRSRAFVTTAIQLQLSQFSTASFGYFPFWESRALLKHLNVRFQERFEPYWRRVLAAIRRLY